MGGLLIDFEIKLGFFGLTQVFLEMLATVVPLYPQKHKNPNFLCLIWYFVIVLSNSLPYVAW